MYDNNVALNYFSPVRVHLEKLLTASKLFLSSASVFLETSDFNCMDKTAETFFIYLICVTQKEIKQICNIKSNSICCGHQLL